MKVTTKINEKTIEKCRKTLYNNDCQFCNCTEIECMRELIKIVKNSRKEKTK